MPGFSSWRERSDRRIRSRIFYLNKKARRHGGSLGLPWFFLPVLIIGGMAVVNLVRPDPKTIGMNLSDYWPGIPKGVATEKKAPAPFSARKLPADPSIRLAIISNCAARKAAAGPASGWALRCR